MNERKNDTHSGFLILDVIFHFHQEDLESRQNSLLVKFFSTNTKWLQALNLLFNLFTPYFMNDMEKASFHNFIINFHLNFLKVFPAIQESTRRSPF